MKTTSGVRYWALGLSIAISLLAVAAKAEEKPSAADVKKVMDFYQSGKEAVLLESKFCKDIGKDAATKNDCVGELTGEMKKGDKGFLWMNFLLPKNFTAGNLIIQYKQKDLVRNASTREVKAKDGSLRYRIFNSIPALPAGDFEVMLMMDVEGQMVELAKLPLKVS